mgnify:FL=1
MNNNRIADLSCLPLLRTLPSLTTVYLEQNPCAGAGPTYKPTQIGAGAGTPAAKAYRAQVAAALPQLLQLDADEIVR